MVSFALARTNRSSLKGAKDTGFRFAGDVPNGSKRNVPAEV
jgi:hypothetical protein